METLEQKRARAEALRGKVKALEPSEDDKLDRELTRLELEVAEREAQARIGAKRARAELNILAAQRMHGTIAAGKIGVIDSYGDTVILKCPDGGHFLMSVEQSAAAPSHGVKMDIELELVIHCLVWCDGAKDLDGVAAPSSAAEAPSILPAAEAFQRLNADRPGLFLACSKMINMLNGTAAEARAGK